MVFLTIPAVHTTGINWQSIGVILAALVALLAFLVGFQEHRNTAVKDQIRASVDHLSEVLTGKLETKEAVSRLSERIARLEGPAQRISVVESEHPEHTGADLGR